MPLLEKFKNIFKGGSGGDSRRNQLSRYVQYNVDPHFHWEILGDIGDGAFGKVQKARHKEDPNRLAAAKVIEVKEEEDVTDFMVEIEILSESRHANILRLYEAFFHDDYLWMLLEYCSCGAVDQIMVELEKALTEPQIRYVSHFVCQAMHYLHGRHIIHRDLKAGNILLTNEGHVKLADFGVSAKNKSAAQKRDSFIGTPYWMAPEVMVCETFKDQPYDIQADIWSFGITLIEMAEIEPPNSEMSPMRVLLKIQKNPPPTLARPSLWSRDFSEFLTRCLQKSPQKRLSASELLKHRFLENQTNRKPILELLSEASAEVIEEIKEEIDADRLSVDSEATDNGNNSRDGTRSQRSISRQATEENDVSIIEPVPRATSSPKIARDDSKIGDNTINEQFEPSSYLVNGDKVEEKENVYVPPSEKRKRAAPRPPEPVAKTLLDDERNIVTNTVIEINLEAKDTESQAEIELKEKQVSERLNSTDHVQSILSNPENDNDIQTSANKILDDLDDSLNAEYKDGVVHSDSVSSFSTQFVHEQSPSIGLVVDDMIDRVENENKTLAVTNSTIPSQQEQQHIQNSGDQVLRVHIPSPPPPVEAEQPAAVDYNRVDETNEDTPLSPVVKFRDDMASPHEENTKLSPSIMRRTSAAKEFFELKQRESVQSGHSHTSREGLDIPLGIIQKAKERVLSHDDSHSSASSRGSNASTSEMHRSVHEIASGFRSSPASDGESVPIRPQNGDVKRRVHAQPPAPPSSYNSTPALASTSPKQAHKRKSAPGYASNEFQEKASAVNAMLAKNLEKKQHRKPPVPPPKSPRGAGAPSDVLPPHGTQYIQDDSQRLVYFGDFNQPTPQVDVDNGPARPSSTPASISPSTASRQYTQQENGDEFQPVSAFEYQQQQHGQRAGEHEQRVPLRIGVDYPTNVDKSKSKSPRNASASHSPVPVAPPQVPHAHAHQLQDSEGRRPQGPSPVPPPEPPIDYDEATPRPRPLDHDHDHARPLALLPSTPGVANIVRKQDSLPDERTSNLSREESQTSSTRSSGNKTSSHGSSSKLHRNVLTPTEDRQSYASSNGSAGKREREVEPEPPPKGVVHRQPRPLQLVPTQELKVSNGDESVGQRRDPYRRTVTKKTRQYMVDGVAMTSTTYHIMNQEGHDFKAREDFNIRKAELQELKRLQKDETRQLQDLSLQSQMVRDQQDKKFDAERMNLMRTFDVDIENLSRTQKKQIEEAERVQEDELRQTAKRLRLDQDREVKVFRERLKQEAKLMKQELEMLPKAQRKEMGRRRRESMDAEHSERERQYAEQLTHANAQTIQRLEDSHRSRIALLEKQFLQQKHQVLRAREAAIWELEERHLQDKHQTNKQQLKDYFFLQRAQMLQRHQKELDHIKRLNARKEEELIQAMIVEKKRLPKVLRSEKKTRSLMFKESLRISMVDPQEMVDKMRHFEDKEKKRVDVEIAKQDAKHKRKLEQLRAANDATLKELEHIQNEKRKMLVEHETNKLGKYDEEYDVAREEWRSKLKPRKQALESKLAGEMEEQDRFYANGNAEMSAHYIAASALTPPGPIPPGPSNA